MEFRYDLFTFEHNKMPKLIEWLNTALQSDTGIEAKRVGDYLGTILAESILSRHQVPALSVFCWDEHLELGDFREDSPALWLTGPLEQVVPGAWKAEGYGFTAYDNIRVVRWIAWKDPDAQKEAFDVYQDISATYNMKRFQESLDVALVKNLVNKNGDISISAAFITVLAEKLETAETIIDAAKEIIFDYLYKHSKP
jgi:hypothetical protein